MSEFNEQLHPRESDGQWASKDEKRWNPGQVIDLWGEDKGSFEFPPRPRNAEDLVDFWRTVTIPEAAARAVVSRQRLLAHEDGTTAAVLARRDYRREVEASRGKYDEAEATRRAQAAYDAAYQEVVQFPQGEVYPSIRAAMMYRDAAYLGPVEREEVRDMTLRFPDGNVTPRMVYDGYRFDRLEDELANPEARSTAALEQMLSELRELRELEERRNRDSDYVTDLVTTR